MQLTSLSLALTRAGFRSLSPTPPPPVSPHILLEDGSALLLEDGSLILLEA